MSPIDWAAVIGAAAWVPQVFGWLSRRFATPLLTVIPGRFPEVGYTSLGPIFNIPCAIAVERKDGIISKVMATVRHEKGQTTEFQWISLNETFSQVRSPEGVAEVGKNQPAVALKVSTLVLTEKLIAMQESTFARDARSHINALQDTYDHLKRTEAGDFKARTLKSKEFAALMAFSKNRFPWQEGKYSVRVKLQVVGVKSLTSQEFAFELTPLEIERMRQNLEEIERYVTDRIVDPDEAEARARRWNWANPPFI